MVQRERQAPECSLKERGTLNVCCKVAVITLALYALKCFMFCSNDCFSAKNADFTLEGIVCSGGFRIHNSKVGGRIENDEVDIARYR